MVTLFPKKCACGATKIEIAANGGVVTLCPKCQREQIQHLKSQQARILLSL